MTHKFVYFSDIENPSPDSVVWYIAIGESSREKKLYQVINSYAAVRGAWFERYEESTLMRLILIEEEVFGRSESVAIRFRTERISASDFVKILRGSDLASIEKKLPQSDSRKLLHNLFDWQFIHRQAKNMAKPSLPSLQRQNLSHSEYTDKWCVLIGSCLILACYLFAAILEVIEKHVLMLS